MTKIVNISPKAEKYFENLIVVLIKKEYFSYRENAEDYVLSILNEIQNYIDVLPHRNPKVSPLPIVKNLKYITINKGKRTSWYVFFTVGKLNKSKFKIRHISNNHSFPNIRGLK
jgi:hypothetical protein